ncbi:MAG: hypothetical protein M3Y69_01365 [Verrucomicrobiota bacterium]|nr:hypothetical protein [Verrucomicrobiota bacterium]
MREVGVQTPYELIASVTEPMAQVDVPAATAVEIIVQAVNSGKQSVPGDAVVYAPVQTVTDKTEVRSAVPAAVLPMADEIVVAPRNGNGSASGNGHGKTSRRPTLA